MPLARALLAARSLLEALTAEVERSGRQRGLLATLQTDALLGEAARRESFNVAVPALEKEVSEAVHENARSIGAIPSLRALTARGVPGAKELAGIIEQVSMQAASLRRLDALNRGIAERALSVVGAYSRALNPRTAAYDRRGASREARSALVTHSTAA
jgi:hypothetical protein